MTFTISKGTVREAAIKTFAFGAPLLIAGAVVAIWSAFGWRWGVVTFLGFVVGSAISWRAAVKSNKSQAGGG